MSKILTHDQVDAWIAALRSAGRKFGYTCGAFDLLHAGHVDYLARSRERCDALLVAVNSDWSIRQYKDPHRPFCSELERMTVVAALASVDAVTILNDLRPLAQIQRWKPDFYIKGGDYATRGLRSGEAVTAYGGQVVTIPVSHLVSTSQIVERILAAEKLAPPSPPGNAPAKGIVFLDRDGTLLKARPYLSDPRAAELLPGVGEGLAELQRAGYRLVIVTNQQGIGLGYFSVREFMAVNTALFHLLAPFGVTISRIYYCPHSAADACDCRKPAPGLLLRALREFGIEAQRCFMIGDRDVDAIAAQSAGCSPVRVGRGRHLRRSRRLDLVPHALAMEGGHTNQKSPPRVIVWNHALAPAGLPLRPAHAAQKPRPDHCDRAVAGHRHRREFRRFQRRGRAPPAPPALSATGPAGRHLAAFARHRHLPRLAVARPVHRHPKRKPLLRGDVHFAVSQLHPHRTR